MGFGPAAPTTPVEVNAPSLWSAGIEWGDAETAGANGYWQTSSTATEREGRPAICIAIGGRRIPEQLRDGSWGLGRSDWMSTLSPNTASFSFVGTIDADLNDTIVVGVMSSVTSQHSDALWVGRVDSVSVTQDVAGRYWSDVSATDIVGVLGQARWTTDLVYGYTLETLTEYLAAQSGISLVVETADDLPPLNYIIDTDMTVLEYVNRAERSSNAAMFLLGNGRLQAVMRKAQVGSVVTTPLTGQDSPTTWTETTSLGNLINRWKLSDGTWEFDEANAASVALYGERAYEATDLIEETGLYFDDLINAEAIAYPRAVVSSADFPVYDLSQRVMWLDPLDWVTHDTDTWQVMSVQHNVSLNDWRVSITADQTQNLLVGEVDPDPVDPPGSGGTTTITQNYTSTKSATILDTGGGNGAGDYLVAGRYDGKVARCFIQFPAIDFNADFPDFIEVVDATLTLRTSDTAWVVFGSSPKVQLNRVTESWSEGTFDDAPPDQYDNSNDINWGNQPSVTSTGEKQRGMGTSENNDITFDITAIAQGWHDDANYGLRLRSTNESSSSRTIEFFSDDYGTAGHRPTLRLKCRVLA